MEQIEIEPVGPEPLEARFARGAEARARLNALARACLAAGATSRTLLLETAEGEFLEALELIPSAANFKKKEARGGG